MLPHFFKVKLEQTRIERIKAFEQPLQIINSLRKANQYRPQNSEFDYVYYRNYIVMSGLINKIDNAIAEFNETKSTSMDNDRAIIEFSRVLQSIIEPMKSQGRNPSWLNELSEQLTLISGLSEQVVIISKH